MENTKHKTTSLEYWLEWIEALKQWVRASPEGIYSNPSYTVKDVPYAALTAIGGHFEQRVYDEGRDHRRVVYVDVWHGMSMTQVEFKSPEREFTYKPLKKEKPLD